MIEILLFFNNVLPLGIIIISQLQATKSQLKNCTQKIKLQEVLNQTFPLFIRGQIEQFQHIYPIKKKRELIIQSECIFSISQKIFKNHLHPVFVLFPYLGMGQNTNNLAVLFDFCQVYVDFFLAILSSPFFSMVSESLLFRARPLMKTQAI